MTEGIYKLDIPKNFRTTEWAENDDISNFYRFFSDRLNINKIKCLEVDFSNCRWIDPFPIMSLLTFFAQNIAPYLENIYFIFPKPQINEPYHNNYLESDQNKVLRFLLKEGFIAIIDLLKIKTSLSTIDIKLINDLGDVLNYFDCHLCDSKLINTESDNIENAINDTMAKMKVNLQKRKLSSLIINRFIYKTRVFFTETLDNVREYAYDKGDNIKYAMIYGRYRYGAKSSINNIQKQRLALLIKYERQSYPHVVFYQDCYYDKDGFLEVFIIDVGKGIAETLGFRTPYNKWPAQKAFYSVITQDRNKPGKTLFGGLKHISKILVNDQILLKDREEWLGCKLPLLKTGTYHEGILPKLTERYHIRGCYWLARISWSNNYEIDLKIWHKIRPENYKYFLAIYKNEYNNSKELFNNYAFIDERFHPFFDNWNLRNKVYSDELSNHKSKTIYFSPEGTQKHLILDHILVTFIKNLSAETNLFIVDINIEEAPTYISAIHMANLPLSDEYKHNVCFLPRIFLITKNLSWCVLNYNNEKNQYILKNESVERSSEGENKDDEFSLIEILKSIITYDSFSIWQEVLSLKKLHTFINSNIIWDISTGKRISGYLDFNQLCTVPKFTKLFEIGVLRFVGIALNINEIQINPIDSLVKNIVNSLNSQIPYKVGYEKPKLRIGSVLVSGYVQNETNSSDNLSTVLHCFLHPDSDKHDVFRLFVWPHREWIKKFYTPADDIYQRLGRTHSIAPYGWKFYKIPRYDKEGTSLYFRSPQRSYFDWQSENVALRIGNYEYDEYSELFKLDIKYVIDAAFEYYTDLAIFLFVNFFIALGGRKKEEIKDPVMSTKCWNIINQTLADKKAMEFYDDVAFVAYPNHYYANLVIDKLSYLLDKDFFDVRDKSIHSDFSHKIVPLNFIRSSNSNSSGLISSLTIDELNQLLDLKKGEKNVILFDDSIVNGRTRKEIKHLLLNYFEGINEVRTLSIIDRFRLPYDIPNSSKHKSYWRLDIPRLGNKKYNPITDAINKAKRESKKFIPTAQEIVKKWENGWRKRNSFQDDPTHGLDAEMITLKKPYKKFGLEYDKFKKEFIQVGNSGGKNDRTNYIKIENSIGASVYAIETYCLTGRDDIAYNFAMMEVEEVPDKAKIHILCSFLLLFGSELRYSIKKLMFDKLIDIVNNQISLNDSDNENALACLTIISQNEDFVEDIFYTARLKHKIFYEDLTTALAISLPNMLVQETKFLKRIFLDNSSNKDWNDRKTLHLELYEQGSAHINIFRTFIEKRDNSCSPKDLIFCLDQFNDICKHLNSHLYKNLASNKDEILEKISSCNQLLKESLKKNNINEKNQQVIDDLMHLNKLLLGIHSNIFYQLSDKNNHITLSTDNFFINNIVNSLDPEFWSKVAKEKHVDTRGNVVPKIFHTNNLTEVIKSLNSLDLPLWIPFERSIYLHIRNIISNVMHGPYEIIESPFKNSIKGEAHLWYDIELDIENFELILIFANPYKSDGKDYVRLSNNSIREEKYYSDKLQCQTEYYTDPTKSNILFCKVTLPILK